jgi:type I restriction enzyme R subunit
MTSEDASGGAAQTYLAREAQARIEIDKQLVAAGWSVQSQDALNLSAGVGVAVREFTLKKPHGRVDYLLFLNGQAAGVIEAKPAGTTLVEVERQAAKYVEGLPDWMTPPVYPLPLFYESTGAETRFTNGYDPDARSRRVFTFHRPETLAEWTRQILADPDLPTFGARLKNMPPLDEHGLWGKQAEAFGGVRDRHHDLGIGIGHRLQGSDYPSHDIICHSGHDVVGNRPHDITQSTQGVIGVTRRR